MRTIHPELFIKRVPTEYTAYQLLKNDPLYLPIPWAGIINKGIKINPNQIRLPGGYTICQHISYTQIIPILLKAGIKILHTPHVDKQHPKIKILPFPHFAVNTGPPKKKTIHYSFIGADTHKVRKVLFGLPQHSDVIIKRRGGWHWYTNKGIKDRKEEYIDILCKSRFSLCPRGTGPSTIRFWESLKAGAIPVLLSDNMQLPDTFNWDTCIIRVPQKNTKDIHEIITEISREMENDLRNNCYKAYNANSGGNFVSCIRGRR